MDGDTAASQAADIRDLIDWEELRRLVEPVTMDLVAATYTKWWFGQEGKWLFAALLVPEPQRPRHSPLQAVVLAITPLGLAEQLQIQERLRSLPDDRFLLQGRIGAILG